MNFLYYKAVNWNETFDNLDTYTWEKLTNHFWLDTRLPMREDFDAWKNLPQKTQQILIQFLASASLNAALHAEIGAPSLRPAIQTQQEEAVLNILTFLESVHTKAYTSIFRGLVSDEKTQIGYDFADHHPLLQQQIGLLENVFEQGEALQKKAAFFLANTVLTFGKLAPLLQQTALNQTKQMLRQILQGTGIFSAYLGYKFQKTYWLLDEMEKSKFKTWFEDFSQELIQLEQAFLAELLTDDDFKTSLDALQFGLVYTYQTLGFHKPNEETPSPVIKQMFQPYLMTTKQMTQQAQVIFSQQDEAMQVSDYQF
ncbi:ribonucleotide-diphosphate reductase subunit beta [Enterococcus lemanii]|uniref:Ribonucleotide-diphosphate reductase subunit beta n=1 Tax=Enterococcus lemanii TaxID=1159752 RepID=A0ABV9MWA7_9ENTE|nr:ribonucleotide-diphosphate reductase subunit beta [Enterococcus lemanii]MBM7708275.1 ribonucleoside-diphosphate reductase beta chain [Enterococcus lemanii]